MRHVVVLSVAAAMSVVAPVLGQGQPVQLQLRFVPESGGFGPTSPVFTNAPVNGPISLASSTPERIRLDYRILDINTGDAIHPAGLASAVLAITASGVSGGLGSWTIAKGLLTSREAGQGAVPPPTISGAGVSADTWTGNDGSVADAGGRTGLASPFRGAMADQNNNADPANGTIGGSSILSIVALSASQNNQGLAGYGDGGMSPAFPLSGNEWYTLYVFTVTPSPQGTGQTWTAVVVPDAGTGFAFRYFRDGVATPQGGTDAQSASIQFLPYYGTPSGTCCRGATCYVYLDQNSCLRPTAHAGVIFRPGSPGCNSAGVRTSPCCEADYNKANGITVQDLFDFLSDWFQGSPFARVGGDGTGGVPGVQSVFDFLAGWFAGGC